jgi:hypothetical protein
MPTMKILMTSKARLVKIAALYLAVPFTLALAGVELRSSNANPLQQWSDRDSQSLGLGKPNLSESRQSTQVTPGVTHTVIVRGGQSERDVYTVDVAFQTTVRAAQEIADSLRSQGYQPYIQPIVERVLDDLKPGLIGYLVRVGAFATEVEAMNLRSSLAAVGYSGLRVVYTGEDGGTTTGPWVVNVLEVDPVQFKGKVTAALGTDIVPGNERLTQISTRTGALASVNGGYFVIGAPDGTPGDLAGVSVIDGKLISEAVNGRTSLILPFSSGKDARVRANAS